MKDIPDPSLKEEEAPEKDLSEDTLSEVHGGRRILPPSRRDIEVEDDSRFHPKDVRQPTKIVEL